MGAHMSRRHVRALLSADTVVILCIEWAASVPDLLGKNRKRGVRSRACGMSWSTCCGGNRHKRTFATNAVQPGNRGGRLEPERGGNGRFEGRRCCRQLSDATL